MSELTINGKLVVVQQSFRGKEWYSLPAAYRRAWKGAATGDYGPAIPFLARVIESWEFDGNPTDEAAYERLDILAELVPLADGVLLAVSEAAFPKTDAGG